MLVKSCLLLKLFHTFIKLECLFIDKKLQINAYGGPLGNCKTKFSILGCVSIVQQVWFFSDDSDVFTEGVAYISQVIFLVLIHEFYIERESNSGVIITTTQKRQTNGFMK